MRAFIFRYILKASLEYKIFWHLSLSVLFSNMTTFRSSCIMFIFSSITSVFVNMLYWSQCSKPDEELNELNEDSKRPSHCYTCLHHPLFASLLYQKPYLVRWVGCPDNVGQFDEVLVDLQVVGVGLGSGVVQPADPGPGDFLSLHTGNLLWWDLSVQDDPVGTLGSNLLCHF